MIGLAFRAFFGGVGGDGICGLVLGGFLAICAICGLYKCSSLKMRDCGCFKRWMRVTGADPFDDFHLTVLVHEALYTSQNTKLGTKVRLKAGDQHVSTDASHNHTIEQHLEVFVAQGTEELVVELMDDAGRKVLAVKKFSIAKDICDVGHRGKEMTHQMKQSTKTILNPKIKLTFFLESDRVMEEGLMKKMNVSVEASALMCHQLSKAAQQCSGDDDASLDKPRYPKAPDAQTMSELELCLKCCNGPIEKYGSWGSRRTVYIAAQARGNHYFLGIWKSHVDYECGRPAEQEIDLMKVASVVPDPHPRRNEVFLVQYVQNHKRERLTFRRIDRARNVWVEMFQVLIKMLHDRQHERRAGNRAKTKTK